MCQFKSATVHFTLMACPNGVNPLFYTLQGIYSISCGGSCLVTQKTDQLIWWSRHFFLPWGTELYLAIDSKILGLAQHYQLHTATYNFWGNRGSWVAALSGQFSTFVEALPGLNTKCYLEWPLLTFAVIYLPENFLPLIRRTVEVCFFSKNHFKKHPHTVVYL